VQQRLSEPEFYPVNLTDFSGGLQTKFDAGEIKDNESPIMVNAVITAKGALTRRKGVRRLGTDTGTGPAKTLYKFSTSDGTDYLLKAIDTKIKVFNSATGVWDDSEVGLTDGLKWGFVHYEDTVYGGNGTDDDMYSTDPTTAWTATGANPKGNIQLIMGGRRLIATGATLYYTKATDRNDFTTTGGGATNDGGYTTLPGEITAMENFADYDGAGIAMVYCANNKAYSFIITDDADTTAGTNAVFTESKSETTSTNHFATTTVDNDIYGPDLFNQIRSLGYKEYLPNVQTDIVSEAIEDTMDDLTLTNAVSTLFDRQYILSAQTEDSTINDVQVIFLPFYKAWTTYLGVGANSYAIYDDKLTYVSSSDDNAYYFDEESLDDEAGTVTGHAIYFKYATKSLDFGVPLRLKQCQRIRFGGFISETCNLTIKAFYNASPTPAFTWTIKGNNANLLEGELADQSIGSEVWGGAALGGGTSSGLHAFSVDCEASSLVDFEAMQITIENNEAGVDFIINAIKPFVTLKEEDDYPQAKIISPD